MKKSFSFFMCIFICILGLCGCSSKSDKRYEWDISYIPYNDQQDFAQKVEEVIKDKFELESFILKEIEVSTVDSPEHQSNVMVIEGLSGEEKWSKVFNMSYEHFRTLYSAEHPYVVFDAENGICDGDLGLICTIIEHYEK